MSDETESSTLEELAEIDAEGAADQIAEQQRQYAPHAAAARMSNLFMERLEPLRGELSQGTLQAEVRDSTQPHNWILRYLVGDAIADPEQFQPGYVTVDLPIRLIGKTVHLYSGVVYVAGLNGELRLIALHLVYTERGLQNVQRNWTDVEQIWSQDRVLNFDPTDESSAADELITSLRAQKDLALAALKLRVDEEVASAPSP